TGAGTVTIRASQVGNANYNPATNVDRSFLVNAAPPNPPTGVSASSNLSDKITVTWSAASGATGYDVYRNTTNNSGSATKLNGSVVAALTYNDATAVAGTTYSYWIKAKNSTGDSAFSASASGVRLQPGQGIDLRI